MDLSKFKEINGFSNYMIDINGNVYSKKRRRLMKPCIDRKGYMRISTGVFRHGDFNELSQVRVLQNINIGQTVIDSEYEK